MVKYRHWLKRADVTVLVMVYPSTPVHNYSVQNFKNNNWKNVWEILERYWRKFQENFKKRENLREIGDLFEKKKKNWRSKGTCLKEFKNFNKILFLN